MESLKHLVFKDDAVIKRNDKKEPNNYICNKCAEDFPDAVTAKVHIKDRHPEEVKTRCGKCNEICNDKRSLDEHIEAKHGGNIDQQDKISNVINAV